MGLRNIGGALLGLATQRASVENPIYPLTSARLVELLGGPATDSGEQVTAKRAYTVIAFYRAVQIIAGTGGMVPLHAYRRQPAGADQRKPKKVDVTDAYPVLADPHPEMTDYELKEWLFQCIETHGNAFLQKRRFVDGNKTVDGETGLPIVRYLMPIRAELIRVGRSSDGTKWFEFTSPDTGEPVGYTTRDILHIPGLAYDGTLGMSPVDLARQGIGSALAAERYGAALFGRGALISGILQTDRRLPPGAADTLRDRFQELNSGLGNAHKVAVLDQGAKYQPIALSPEAAQFLETRKFSVIEMARLTGVPPHLLMETSAASNWGTGIESQTRGFITFSMAYKFARMAARYTKEILPRGVWAEHRTEELLQADTLQRFQAWAIAIKNGWMSPADVMLEENHEVPEEHPELWDYVTPGGGGGGGGGAAAGEPAPAPGDPQGLQ